MPSPQREIVDTEHRDQSFRRIRQCSHQAQQGRASDGNSQRRRQPRSCSSSQRQCDLFQYSAQQRRALHVSTCQPPDLLDEHRLAAVDVYANEASHLQREETWLASDCRICERALVPTMHSFRVNTACRTARRSRQRRRPNMYTT
ncbi:hypothetical protein M2251_006343 [Rhodococcus erythropolis]|nr:hypothetical protein [Rhodococcus erythropolis]